MADDSGEENSVVEPDDPLWRSFLLALKKVMNSWDLLNQAVDEEWGEFDPARCRTRMIDDLAINFAESWNDGKNVTESQLNSYFTDTFLDFFESDITGTTERLASVLAKVFSECRAGDSTGVDYILSDKFGAAQNYSESPVTPEGTETKTPENDEIGEISQAVSEVQVSDKNEAMEDDGWTTVSKKNR